MAIHRSIVAGWDTENDRPQGVTTAADMRASLHQTANGEGIIYEPGAARTTRLSSRMGFSWTEFTAIIESTLGGWYSLRVEQDEVELAVGDSTYPRIDTVWVRQWDYQNNADHPESEVEIGVTRGTPTAVPSAPNPPSGAVRVFAATVPAGASTGSDLGAITKAPWVTPAGGLITVHTAAEATAAAQNVGATANEQFIVYRADLGALMAWDGSSWHPVSAPVNQLIIGGVAYQARGEMVIPTYTLQGNAPNYYRALTLQMPFTAPSGWQWSGHPHRGGTIPSSMMISGTPVGASMTVMLASTRADARIVSIVWELVPA